ncbi:MAG: acyl-CoA dehydrogenase family protein, partial [Actinobacteria bacterium]|nr:acyl-CoA dehydrogenase family protein [Actinomycetota bacterium]
MAIGRAVIDAAARHLAAAGDEDANQLAAYDLAHAAAAVENASAVLDYGEKGDVENRIARAFVADAVHDVASRMLGREAAWGVELGMIHGALPFVRAHRSAEFLAGLAGEAGPRHLDADFEMVQDTFRRFADDKVRPVAEHIHRENADIPEDIIEGLAEIGTFGLSVPEEYGGYSSGGEGEY